MDRIDQNAGLENGPETTRPLQTTSANNEGNQTMLRDSESTRQSPSSAGLSVMHETGRGTRKRVENLFALLFLQWSSATNTRWELVKSGIVVLTRFHELGRREIVPSPYCQRKRTTILPVHHVHELIWAS